MTTSGSSGAGWTPQWFTAQGSWLRLGAGRFRPLASQGHLDLPWDPSTPSPVPCLSPPTSRLPPQWLSGPPSSSLVDACGPLPFSGRSLGHRHLQGPSGQKGFPQAASSSQWHGFGVGEQAAPWPPAWRWAAGSAWPLAPRCTALRPERWPAALGACTPLLRAEGLRAPAEGVQQGQCLPAAPQLFLDVLPGSFLRSRGRERFPPATEVRALSSLCTSFLP